MPRTSKSFTAGRLALGVKIIVVSSSCGPAVDGWCIGVYNRLVVVVSDADLPWCIATGETSRQPLKPLASTRLRRKRKPSGM